MPEEGRTVAVAPVVDVLDVSVGLGLGQVDDGARDDTAKTMTSVATGGASWSGGWR